jgi:Ni,Fe-hydrogenase III large subunit
LLRLIAACAGQATALAAAAPPGFRRGGSGLGIVEGWRGSTVHRVEISPSGVLTGCKIADPLLSQLARPVGRPGRPIVPDFPLANKSFNLSYAGNDL